MAENRKGVKIDSVMHKILTSGKNKKGETPEDKIGTYKEAPGGGTPLPAGQKAPSSEWVQEHRQMQPRNPDGTFGYNSLNGKDLKYGPSRGFTVPHFLRGVELKFLEKGSKYVVNEGSQYATYILAIDLTKENLIQICKQYRNHQGGFLGAYNEIMEKKKGRQSKEEKEAIAKGEEGEIRKEDGSVAKFNIDNAAQSTKDAINEKEKAAQEKHNISPATQGKQTPANQPQVQKTPIEQKQPVTVGGGDDSSQNYEQYASNQNVINSAKNYLKSIGLDDLDDEDIREAILEGDFTKEDLESWSK